MTLELKLTRVLARFEFNDEDAETVVTVSENDDQEALLRKLKRVVALVEGETAVDGIPMKRAGTLAGAPVLQVGPYPIGQGPTPEQVGNGWAAVYGPPEVPEGADYELIPPGEEA
jgi:succinyl-CoA synthetase alpha subunit